MALWSVGCSSGEEPYSLAISAAEVLRESAAPEHFGVTGTDISLSALGKAREGVYAARKLEQLDESLGARYFAAQDDGRFKVIPSLAARVCCARLNVLELAKAPMSGMDVIFCQNLLIYFRRWRRREILNRLAERLRREGCWWWAWAKEWVGNIRTSCRWPTIRFSHSPGRASRRL